jgi:hypothetical protein
VEKNPFESIKIQKEDYLYELHHTLKATLGIVIIKERAAAMPKLRLPASTRTPLG